jgi:hypothetical protein
MPLDRTLTRPFTTSLPENTTRSTETSTTSTPLSHKGSNCWEPAIPDPGPNPHADPVATYLHIDAKINNPDTEDNSYPVVEMARDLAHLLVAASSLIQMNAAMSEKLLVAQQTAEDAQVQVFYKDMEIHE